MQTFDSSLLKNLSTPSPRSHKGENGKLLLIGGSKLFHAASLWPLSIASKMVDMVFYASVPENNEIVQKSKEEFRNGIVVRREDLENYIQEAECIVLGPGLERTEEKLSPTDDYDIKNFKELDEIEHSGIQTYYLTKYLLGNYKHKKFVIDGGALQMMELGWLKGFKEMPILTPHHKEFERMFGEEGTAESVQKAAQENNCIVLLKGEKDFVCSPKQCVEIPGGNAGMTKGGTGDVLAGLLGSLYCKNEAFLSACAASYINKKAGERLFEKFGYYFNASDLIEEIPRVMKEVIL